ncbi:YaaA family protein [Corynebacterium tapiri]|uniref:Peroxide stress protein YaaA n=1 Tax=Corynebacterium tapiri TaxID=1448266 RepID=A0A5C4U5W2_9CORY|nr:peroxide stress protein YaaA [Corynebacterium tapiri]TNL99272.1 peroxide stress protein YaaA [Corynebacterium tapiri]
MLIVLPPSETKAPGGSGPALDLAKLSFPSLNPIRADLIRELTSLSVDDTMATLKLSEKLRSEAEANHVLQSSATMPAIHRYTGVLYDALDAATLQDHSSIAIASALFGLVRAKDPIPHYRLSGSSKLDGRTMKSWWKSSIADALADEEFVLDLRSGTYQQLGKVAATTVRVEKDGKVVSHFNKHYKGQLARIISQESCSSTQDVVDAARAAGMDAQAESDVITLRV